MARGARQRGEKRPGSGLASRADVLGILQLLASAKASATLHCPDETCADLLDQCISYLEDRHGLSEPDDGDGLMWTEASLPALVRLLDYAQAEVADCLDDSFCVDHLRECIGHLMRLHRLSQEQFYPREAVTSH